MEYQRKCLSCNSVFIALSNQKLYCSEKCKKDYFNTEKIKELRKKYPERAHYCDCCNTPLNYIQISHSSLFCSKSCKMKSQQNSRSKEEVKAQSQKGVETRKSWSEERIKEFKSKISNTFKTKSQEEKELLRKKNSENRIKYYTSKFSNQEDFTEEKIRELFVRNGFFYIDEFRKHFNIHHSSAYDIKYRLNIKEQNYSPFKTHPGYSNKEKELLDTLKSLYPELIFKWQESINRRVFFYKTNKRVALECDILVFKENSLIAGIEYNGSYWHSSEYPETLKKDEFKKEQAKYIPGFKLFQVKENEEFDFYNTFHLFINSLNSRI